MQYSNTALMCAAFLMSIAAVMRDAALMSQSFLVLRRSQESTNDADYEMGMRMALDGGEGGTVLDRAANVAEDKVEPLGESDTSPLLLGNIKITTPAGCPLQSAAHNSYP